MLALLGEYGGHTRKVHLLDERPGGNKAAVTR
jgi:hypothetical protein